MQAILDGKSNRAASFTDSKMFSQEIKSTRSSSINHSPNFDQNLTVYNPPQSFLSISNQIFNDLSQAIQLVQKSYLEKENQDEKLTNSDYQVHELCQQFDYVFLLGLRNREEGYWKVIIEFTHQDVLKELKKLLNVNTSIGRGRAWIYHALNENLMESYLRCFLDNKKFVSKFYTPGISLVSDEQCLSVLVTLVSGLENVEFKLFNDVPYLDHSCWPSHLKLKRQVIDQILNSSTHTIAQKMVDLNNSLTETSLNTSQPLTKEKTKNRPANNVSISEDNTDRITIKPKFKIKKKPRKDLTMDTMSNEELSSSEQIESEIDKLRLENSKLIKKQTGENLISKSLVANNDLAVKSLTASSQFDSKIAHIETYSKIIENATMNMDACVKDMSDVYQNYEKFYQSHEVEQDLSTEMDNENKIISIYEDLTNKSMESTEFNESSEKEKENRNVLFFSSSLSSLQTNNTNLDDTRSNSKDDRDHFSVDSKIENENNYLDDTSCMEDLRQEIKVDNNTKLLLSLEILQNGSNEDIVKLYQCTRGHSQGEIESIFVLITTNGLYILKNQQTNEIQSEINVQNAIKYDKELFMSHDQIDYIEVSLSDQSIHLVCFNKRSNMWITTASRILTNNLLENLQTSRVQNKFSKFIKIPVFHEATQQKLALKKFISNEENSQPQDIEINGYSLIFLEDQTSAINHTIYKEGAIYYFETNHTNHSPEWKKAYSILKNDVFTIYKNQNDKRPLKVIKLDGEEFSGCRKNIKMSKPNTIELIFASSRLYISTKNEEEASDWIQCFCKIISLGNYHSTDVPTLSCLPCCALTTDKKIYFCHEDLVTGFFRLLETIKLEEINRISFDNDNPYYCTLHDDINSTKKRYWFIYFVDRNERNEFITCFKKTWEDIFQVQFTVEKSKNIEMRKKCINSVKMIQKSLENSLDLN